MGPRRPPQGMHKGRVPSVMPLAETLQRRASGLCLYDTSALGRHSDSLRLSRLGGSAAAARPLTPTTSSDYAVNFLVTRATARVNILHCARHSPARLFTRSNSQGGRAIWIRLC